MYDYHFPNIFQVFSNSFCWNEEKEEENFLTLKEIGMYKHYACSTTKQMS